MRIGIVNDLPMAVELLRRLVGSVGGHQIVWTAANGVEAVEACRHDLPDLVLMDLTMPEMGGVEATRRIMSETPCPILVVTASIEANITGVYEAMGHGALDVVDIPSVGASGNIATQAAPLLAKIVTIGKLVGDGSSERRRLDHSGGRSSPFGLIAIGASAGGPAALARVLGDLPADLSDALVLVQHVDEKFVPGLVDWLGGHTALRVRAAREGDRPEPGVVLIAASADHLVFKSGEELGYTAELEAAPIAHPSTFSSKVPLSDGRED